MALIEQIPYRGLVAEIAADVYKNAYRQIPATAVVTALALMAGICGRAYSINGKGFVRIPADDVYDSIPS